MSFGLEINRMSVCCAIAPQELEEARRLYTSQKRALKDALSAAAEREAAEAAAGESGLEAATAAAEEEVERLAQVGNWAQQGYRGLIGYAQRQVALRASAPVVSRCHSSSSSSSSSSRLCGRTGVVITQ
jgi:hypothetical protein